MTQQSVAFRDGSEFAAVLAKEEFRAEIDRLFPTVGGKRGPDDIRWQMLRYHHNRSAFDVKIKANGGWQSVIAKLFAIDRQDAFDSMRRIHEAGFGDGAEYGIPRPIEYIPALRVLLEEKVEGRQVKGILLAQDQSEQLKAVRRCGTWLARFHDAAPRFGNRVEPRPLLEHVREWADMVSAFGGPFPAKCDLLMRKLSDALPAKGSFEYCPGHGSYIPSHVLLAGDRTVTIDFDEFELVDPARDLAWFLIAVERFELKYGKSPGFYDRLAKPFLEAYRVATARESMRHLAFYKGAEFLHRARHDLYKRIPPVSAWAEMMLDHGIDGL